MFICDEIALIVKQKASWVNSKNVHAGDVNKYKFSLKSCVFICVLLWRSRKLLTNKVPWNGYEIGVSTLKFKTKWDMPRDIVQLVWDDVERNQVRFQIVLKI